MILVQKPCLCINTDHAINASQLSCTQILKFRFGQNCWISVLFEFFLLFKEIYSLFSQINHRLEAGQLLRSYKVYRLQVWQARVFCEGSRAPWVLKTTEVRGQIWLLNHRLEADQLLRSYKVYRLHLWHARVFCEGSWAPWVSKTTEVRGQI